MAVWLVTLLFEGSLVELLQTETEHKIYLEQDTNIMSVSLYLQTKHSGWNFLNMAVMQRPWMGLWHPAHKLPRRPW